MNTSSLLINEWPLMVQPSLAKRLGSIERAIVLQQVHWLLQQPNSGEIDEDGNRWVWGTMQEWCDLYFRMWKPATLKKHLRWLRENGYLIVEQRSKNPMDRKNYYRIDYRVLEGESAPEAPRKQGPMDPGKGGKTGGCKGRESHLTKGNEDHPSNKGNDRHLAKGNEDHPCLYKEQRCHYRDDTEMSVQRGDARARAPACAPATSPSVLPPWVNPRAWAEFEQHRREMRKPLTDLARKKAWSQLRGLTHEQQQAVVDYSIAGRYQGLFPDRLKRNSTSLPVNRKVALEERNRAVAQAYLEMTAREDAQ